MNQPAPRRHPRRESGFTLIEIMAVVVIMGFLIGIVGINIKGTIDKGRIQSTKMQIASLDTALQSYYGDAGRYPTTDQGLDALVREPTIAPVPRSYQPGGYLAKPQLPLDAWGAPFAYEAPGQRNPNGYDLWSYGSDGEIGGDGTAADIGNWSEASDFE